jgi:ABC-2 type transport system permease protein
MVSFTAIYVLWLRELKKFIRSKARIIGSLTTPLLFLAGLGLGFSGTKVPGIEATSYLQFLTPGIVGMSLLFSSTFAGLTLLLDREFGFLKEIMVAPVDRISIVLGRTAGGLTTGLIQALLILLVALVAQKELISVAALLLSIVFIILTSCTFIGIGLIFASMMRDTQGFNLVVNFLIFPLFFLSGALYPINNLPNWLKSISLIDPLTYGVDGLRGAMIGASHFSLFLDFIVLAVFSTVTVFLGAYFFERSQSL